MCGIAGGFNISRETVHKMNELQGSRGPDNAGIKEIGKVIFGHTRLSIIDKSERSNQPIGSMLTYNGELYDIDPNFSSDTLWLSHLLEFYETGTRELEDTLNVLNGMFAFAYFDDKIIHLIRDRFGIKPLYFTHQKDYFAFASTPSAVALTKSNWNISEKGLHEYLALGATALHSMFEGIEAVPPGWYVTFDCRTGEVKKTQWYFPRFVENAMQTIIEKIITAIDRVKLTCDWPQIILLSGGIDSSLVASRYKGNSAIHLKSPEKEYAEQVAKKFDIDLHNVDPEIHNAEECLIDYISKSGDPTMAGIIPYMTCKEIKKLGYRVAITANGADELFWGYNRMQNVSDQRTAIFREFSFTQEVIERSLIYRQIETNFGELNGIPLRETKSIEQAFWLESLYLMFDLNKTLDFASMCHSVEVRVPYLDHELVEAALSIPQSEHVGRYGNKTILKRILLDLGFDYPFIHRPKMGFSLYHDPADWTRLQDKAMKWYEGSGYEQLGAMATGRQCNYHRSTVSGLYLWMKINKFV